MVRTSKASGSLSVLDRVCQSLRPPFLSPTLVLCCVVKTGIWRNHGIPATWGSEAKNWIYWRRPNGFGISQRIHIFGIDYAKSNIGICPFRQQLGKESWKALIRKEWIFVPEDLIYLFRKRGENSKPIPHMTIKKSCKNVISSFWQWSLIFFQLFWETFVKILEPESMCI